MESKGRLKTRLEAEGRWEDFKARREQLKDEGVPDNKAWGVAAKEFPPLPVRREQDATVTAHSAEPTGSSQGTEKPPSGKQPAKNPPPGKTCTNREGAEWVAANLSNDDVQPADAPSPTAWSMLLWARRSESNEDEFWKSIYTKLLPSRSELEKKDRGRESSKSVQQLTADYLRLLEEHDGKLPEPSYDLDPDDDVLPSGIETPA